MNKRTVEWGGIISTIRLVVLCLLGLTQLANSAFGSRLLYDSSLLCFCARRAQKHNRAKLESTMLPQANQLRNSYSIRLLLWSSSWMAVRPHGEQPSNQKEKSILPRVRSLRSRPKQKE